MDPLVRTARTTGLLYALLGVTGMLGFLVIRPQVFDPTDPAGTLAQLVAHETLARTGVVLEMGVVVTQVLVALWFFRLFRRVDDTLAASIAVLGLMNAVAVLGSAAALTTAIDVAGDAALAPTGGDAGTIGMLVLMSERFWTLGNVFFGLWLVPMGMAVLRSGWMPAALGRILLVGGAGYVLSALVLLLMPSWQALADVLVVPATVGELWMMGYLLVRGVRRTAVLAPPAATPAPSTFAT